MYRELRRAEHCAGGILKQHKYLLLRGWGLGGGQDMDDDYPRFKRNWGIPASAFVFFKDKKNLKSEITINFYYVPELEEALG